VTISYAVDAVNCFRGFYYVEGWAHDGGAAVPPELLAQERVLPTVVERVPRPDLAASKAPTLCGFQVRYIMRDGDDPREFVLRLRTSTEENCIKNPGLEPFQRGVVAWRKAEDAFFSRLRRGASVLELGSRAREGVSRRGLFKDLVYTGFDLKNGDNVDVVGDAHRLPALFEREQFDFAYSVSVFEHLYWPWKVALALNAVLKTGGLILNQSHQTWPRHAEPWDFFRFSASGWRSLFCEATGFRIVDSVEGMPACIVPAHYTGDPSVEFGQQPAFLVSICVAEKIGEPRVRWDAEPRYGDLGSYPV